MSGTLSKSLSEGKHKRAEETKQRTLNILSDALRKKKHLLVENPEDFSECRPCKDIPLISPSLIQDLIAELRKVAFTRGESENYIAYVYSQTDERVIYLCAPFWKQSEFLEEDSRPETLIHEVCHFLGYGHTVEETTENAKKEKFQQRKLLPLTAISIPSAFVLYMNHKEPYTDGSYDCCGERARDSVCVRSEMIDHLRILKLFSKTLKNDRKRFSQGFEIIKSRCVT